MFARIVILVLAIITAVMAQVSSYVISTVAGTGTLPINGAALTTPVGQPMGIAIDLSGNIFFTNSFSVFKIDRAGLLTRIAGTGVWGDSGDGGPAMNASFKGLTAIALDRAGNIFVADSSAGRVRKIATDGTISTIAGTGQSCCYIDGAGEGGPATEAQLFYPFQLAVDAKDNVYIGSWSLPRIRQVAPDGIIRTVVGVGGIPGYSGDGGPASKAQIGAPWGLAFDADGDLYFSDAIPGEDIGPVATHIRKVTPDGIISTIAGSGDIGSAGDGGPALSARFSMPGSLAAAPSGDIYVTDGARIRKISSDGAITTVAGNGTSGYSGDGGSASQATIGQTIDGQWLGLAVDSVGNLYVADTLNLRVREVTTGGAIDTIAGNGHTACCFSGDDGPASSMQLNGPVGVAAAPDGSLYVSDTYNNRIRRVDPGGIMSTVAGEEPSYLTPPQALGSPPVGDNGPAIFGQLAIPAGLAFDSSGNLFVADPGDNRVRKITTDGIISTVAGTGACCFAGDSGPATAAQLYWPEDVAVDSSGRIYIADTGNHRVRVVSPDGSITTAAGNGSPGYLGDGGPANSASLNLPAGVAVDRAGNLYIADTNNHRIRKVSPTGIISTVAGSGVAGLSGDGGPAFSARLFYPVSVKVDSAGNLYIGDGVAVRMVSPSGIISTIAGNGTLGNTGDGGPSLGAQIGVWGLTVSSAGVIYVADPWDYLIRKLTPAKAP